MSLEMVNENGKIHQNKSCFSLKKKKILRSLEVVFALSKKQFVPKMVDGNSCFE